jgi:arsenite methyltransferase
MANGLEFDEETTRKVEALYETPGVKARRRIIAEKIALKPGEHVIDIGSGPGFLARDMAASVGPSGGVLGVDVSDAMLAMAQTRCEPFGWASFQKGDALELPAEDNSFDVAVSVQVYEYVQQVDRALSEMCRILKPGGRALVVSLDWNSLAWHASDEGRMTRVMDEFAAHCAYKSLPVTLGPRMAGAGLTITDRHVIPQLEAEFDEASYSAQVIPIVASFVSARPGIEASEAQAWADDLREVGGRGEYFFCLNQYLFSAVRSA